MAFQAAVTAHLDIGGETPRTVKAKYHVEGPVPEPVVIADEITVDKLPPDLKNIQVQGTGHSIVPMGIRAKLDASRGMLYLILDVHEDTGHHWNNLSDPPTVSLKAVSGMVIEKTSLLATKHDGDGDTESRILAVPVTLEPGAMGFVIEAKPEAWICHDEEGWCRIFAKTFKITGRL